MLPTPGLAYPPSLPPEQVARVAAAAAEAGLEELWFSEDCFHAGGVASVTAALATTRGSPMRVGAALLPVPLRNVAAVAMEVAALARMFPGRSVVAVGHGIQPWMAQAGAAVTSPLTLLREHVEALRGLLAGGPVDVSGHYVRLEGVALAHPPDPPPPLLVGGGGPRTLDLAAATADGTVLPMGLGAADLAAAVARVRAAAPAGHRIVASVPIAVGSTARERLDAGLASYAMPPGGGVAGSVEEVAAGLREVSAAGVDAVTVVPVATEPDVVALVEILVREVAPLVAH